MSLSYIAKALREQVTVEARRRCGYCLTSSRIIGMPMELARRAWVIVGWHPPPD